MKIFRLSSRMLLLLVVVIASFLAAFIGQIVVTNYAQGPSLVSNQGFIIRQSDNPFLNLEKAEADIQEERQSLVEIYKRTSAGFDLVSQGVIVTTDGWIASVDKPNTLAESWTHVRLENGELYEIENEATDNSTGLRFVSIDVNGLRPIVSNKDPEFSKYIPYAVLRVDGSSSLAYINGLIRNASVYNTADAIVDYHHASTGQHADVLMNEKAEMVGMIKYEDSLSKVVSTAEISDRLTRLLKSETIDTPRLGLLYIDLAHTVIDSSLENENVKGALISNDYLTFDLDTALPRTSPAFTSGLRLGDLITHADGEELTKDYSLTDAVLSKDVGDQIELEVIRNNQKLTFQITLE